MPIRGLPALKAADVRSTETNGIHSGVNLVTRPVLLAKFNAGLKSVRADGAYDKILGRYPSITAR